MRHDRCPYPVRIYPPMKHLFSLTLLFACLTLAFSGCDKAEVVEPTAAEEPVELTPEEQAEYDKEMAQQMGN
ncbi:hypothetical protein-signal peptide and transmembrane prediction [Rhodopirellula baltica SH 1]|uniref:Secreted protein n=3 Tax=Rhodopirellula baltica TaxID=265606 RepID=Q7UY54_RHOBA|nr:hypothetical protein-signal peptide and transmembrane prediction [Rhodopirellula baltica SH 1]